MNGAPATIAVSLSTSPNKRGPESPETRSQVHRSISENPFVVGVWGFRATLYEGEGGALCGALLPITVFLAVKVTGGPGLASWDRALVGVWLRRGTLSGAGLVFDNPCRVERDEQHDVRSAVSDRKESHES